MKGSALLKQSIRGHCSCREIQYDFTGDIIWVGHCHCADCRRQCGSAVATFVSFSPKDFKFSKGTPRKFKSSPGVSRTFCGNCGTPISYQAQTLPDEIHLHIGTLSDPEDFPAQSHVFSGEKLSWFEINDEIIRFDTLPPGRDVASTLTG